MEFNCRLLPSADAGASPEAAEMHRRLQRMDLVQNFTNLTSKLVENTTKTHRDLLKKGVAAIKVESTTDSLRIHSPDSGIEEQRTCMKIHRVFSVNTQPRE